MSKAAKSPDAPARKKGGKLFLIVGLVLLLAGGGGGYFWWTRQQAVKAAEAAGHGTPAAAGEHGETPGEAATGGGDAHAGVLLPLDTFTVNLADTEATRFLRTTVQLVLDADEDALKALEHEKVAVVRARAAVLELLSEQTSAAISTPAGKAALKQEISKRAAKALHHKVSDVLFSDFVIQF